MSNTDILFETFNASLKGKVKCTNCMKTCSKFCPDACLDYKQKQIPDYRCNYLRDAYVLRYFPTHEAEIKKLYEINTDQIFRFMSLKKRQDKLVILGLGAGPGTDLIAFCEWLYKHKSQIEKQILVTFIRADDNDDWINQYNKLRKIYKSTNNSEKANFTYKKRIVDAFDASGWPRNTHITSASYLLSELTSKNNITSCKAIVSNFWAEFRDKLDDRSIILINDRPEEDVQMLSDYLANLVKTTYRKSIYKEYCFKKDCFKNVTGITFHNNDWCGCHLPDNMRSTYKSKTVCTSYQCIIFVDKS